MVVVAKAIAISRMLFEGEGLTAFSSKKSLSMHRTVTFDVKLQQKFP